MARLKAITRTVLGDEVTFQIKVNTKGKFSSSWPAVIKERTDVVGFEEFATMEAVITEIDRVVEEVNNQNTEVEYLIAYHVETRNSPELWTENCHRLELLWSPYRKTTIGKSVVYNYISYDTFGHHKKEQLPVPGYYVLGNEWSWGDSNGSRSNHRKTANPKEDPTMPFTPENVAFFVSIGLQLTELNDRITEFLEPERVQKFIAANLPLQLTTQLGGK